MTVHMWPGGPPRSANDNRFPIDARTEFYHRLGRRLVHLQLALDLTDFRLAEIMGVTVRTLRRYKAGLRPKTGVPLFELCLYIDERYPSMFGRFCDWIYAPNPKFPPPQFLRVVE